MAGPTTERQTGKSVGLQLKRALGAVRVLVGGRGGGAPRTNCRRVQDASPLQRRRLPGRGQGLAVKRSSWSEAWQSGADRSGR